MEAKSEKNECSGRKLNPDALEDDSLDRMHAAESRASELQAEVERLRGFCDWLLGDVHVEGGWPDVEIVERAVDSGLVTKDENGTCRYVPAARASGAGEG